MAFSLESRGLKPTVEQSKHGGLVILEPSDIPRAIADHADSEVRLDETAQYYRFIANLQADRINSLLGSRRLGPSFTPGEIRFSPDKGVQVVLDTGVVPIVIWDIDKEGNRKASVKHINPMNYDETMRNLQKEGRRVENLPPFAGLGRGGMLVTFPANFGGKAEILFSMVMREESKRIDPLVIMGRQKDLEEKISNLHVPFKPMRMSKETFEKYHSQLLESQAWFGGVRVNLPENMIAHELDSQTMTVVDDAEVQFHNGNFFTVARFKLTNGEITGRLLNKAQEQKGDINEGAGFVVITPDSQGKPVIAIVRQRRAHGNTTTIETPRGFAEKVLGNELWEEVGLKPETIDEYRTKHVKIAQDPLFENNLYDLSVLELPSSKRFNLESKAKERPAAFIEDLVPNWMRLEDVVKGAVTGELVNDAHTIASIFSFIQQKNAFVFSEEVGKQAIIMEVVQDFRTGEGRLTIPRGDHNLAQQTMNGEVNPNSGAVRGWDRIGYGTNSNGLEKGRSYHIIQLKDLVTHIETTDIVTMSAVFKTLLQMGHAHIDWSKLSSK